jgi:exopolyphosphatase/guanosine-5'-triphosphate,3'-diphosphate pyrophosphatase
MGFRTDLWAAIDIGSQSAQLLICKKLSAEDEIEPVVIVAKESQFAQAIVPQEEKVLSKKRTKKKDSIHEVIPETLWDPFADRVFQRLQDCIQVVKTVGLGSDLKNGEGEISEQKIQKLESVLKEFQQMIRTTRAKLKGVLLTEAARKAQNSEFLLQRIEMLTQLKPQILQGHEEAELSWIGAVSTRVKDRPYGVLDLGGGSFEISVFGQKWSFPLGVVRMMQQFGVSPDAGRFKPYVLDVLRDLPIQQFKSVEWVVVGGTGTALAMLHQGLVDYEPTLIENTVLARSDLESMERRLVDLSPSVRGSLPGMVEGRGELIVCGLQILRWTLEFFSTDKMVVSTRGLHHGFLMSLEEEII